MVRDGCTLPVREGLRQVSQGVRGLCEVPTKTPGDIQLESLAVFFPARPPPPSFLGMGVEWRLLRKVDFAISPTERDKLPKRRRPIDSVV